jgi:hypothetical protein
VIDEALLLQLGERREWFGNRVGLGAIEPSDP